MARKPKKDWEWIWKQYQLGFSHRRIVEMYIEKYPHENITHQAIGAYAKRHGWEISQEAVVAFQQQTKSKSLRKSVERSILNRTGPGRERHEIETSRLTADEVIEVGAEIASEVESEHKSVGAALRVAAQKCLQVIVANVAVNTVTKGSQLVKQEMTPAAQAKALKDISIILEKAVSIERKSWNMDKNDCGGPAGVFQININVPDPLPLPEHLR